MSDNKTKARLCLNWDPSPAPTPLVDILSSALVKIAAEGCYDDEHCELSDVCGCALVGCPACVASKAIERMVEFDGLERWRRISEERPTFEALIVRDVLKELAGREGIGEALMSADIHPETRDEIIRTLVEIVADWLKDVPS